MAYIAEYPFWGLAILFLIVPTAAAALLRRRERKVLRAVISGVGCSLILASYALYQVDVQGEMAGYTWLFHYAPGSAAGGFIAGFLLTILWSGRPAGGDRGERE